MLLWLVEWEWLDENLNGWMINGQVSTDALWLHIVPPDYTFRLPKLHLCIWGVNRSAFISYGVGMGQHKEAKFRCCRCMTHWIGPSLSMVWMWYTTVVAERTQLLWLYRTALEKCAHLYDEKQCCVSSYRWVHFSRAVLSTSPAVVHSFIWL